MSGLNPDRRSASHAHHLRPNRSDDGTVCPRKSHHPNLEQGEEIEKGEDKISPCDFVVDESTRPALYRTRLGKGRRPARHRKSPSENWELSTTLRRHQAQSALQAMWRCGKGWGSDYRGTFTGPSNAGPPHLMELHQAVEAKEASNIRREDRRSQPSPSRNYFRLYKKLAGMMVRQRRKLPSSTRLQA